MVVVHVSGAILDPHFTSMASQIVLGIFILLEFIRSATKTQFPSCNFNFNAWMNKLRLGERKMSCVPQEGEKQTRKRCLSMPHLIVEKKGKTDQKLGSWPRCDLTRAHKIEPFASVLNQAFSLFVDDKDRGSLVLTNIYLLVGTFSPLWLAPQRHLVSRHLSIFSGVLSVGIGDAVASVVGSRFGSLWSRQAAPLA